MRDILFRGKRVDNGEWVEGYLTIEEPPLQCFKTEKQEASRYLIGKSGFADWNMPRPFTNFEVVPESVGQYIGLKDEKDKKAYIDDIIRIDYKYESCGEHGVEPDQDCFCQGIIIYDDERACFSLKIIESEQMDIIDVDDIIPLFYFDLEGSFEILGNIHDKK